MPITKQTIAIIGSSSIMGTANAKGLCSENYRLLLFEEDEVRADQLKDQICSDVKGADVDVIECQHLASWEADVIVIALSSNEIQELSKNIQDVATQKIIAVILRDGNLQQLEEIEIEFPNSKVVGLTPINNDPSSVRLLTKHTRALHTIKEMVEQAGFQPILKELRLH